MTRAKRAEAAARLQASVQPVDDPQVPASRLGGYVRTDPVVQTVKLPPTRNAGLKEWCAEASIQFGRPPGRRGVTVQAVLAALVAELLVDETIAGRVRARLRQEYGSQ